MLKIVATTIQSRPIPSSIKKVLEKAPDDFEKTHLSSVSTLLDCLGDPHAIQKFSSSLAKDTPKKRHIIRSLILAIPHLAGRSLQTAFRVLGFAFQSKTPKQIKKIPKSKKWARYNVQLSKQITTFFNTFDSNATPLGLDHLDFNSIINVTRSKRGGDGVFFLDAPNGRLVIKPTILRPRQIDSLDQVTFSDFFLVEMGIDIPRSKVIVPGSKTQQELVNRLELLNQSLKIDCLTPLLNQLKLNQPFILFDCIDGKELFDYDLKEVTALLTTNEILLQLGEIVVYDMFLHNEDRFPNTDHNLMVRTGTKQLVLIDTLCHFQTTEKYESDREGILGQLCKDPAIYWAVNFWRMMTAKAIPAPQGVNEKLSPHLFMQYGVVFAKGVRQAINKLQSKFNSKEAIKTLFEQYKEKYPDVPTSNYVTYKSFKRMIEIVGDLKVK